MDYCFAKHGFGETTIVSIYHHAALHIVYLQLTGKEALGRFCMLQIAET